MGGFKGWSRHARAYRTWPIYYSDPIESIETFGFSIGAFSIRINALRFYTAFSFSVMLQIPLFTNLPLKYNISTTLSWAICAGKRLHWCTSATNCLHCIVFYNCTSGLSPHTTYFHTFHGPDMTPSKQANNQVMRASIVRGDLVLEMTVESVTGTRDCNSLHDTSNQLLLNHLLVAP